LKTVSIGAELTSGGRLLQRRLPATGNARSPTLESHVCQIASCRDTVNQRQRRLELATRWM